MENIQKIYIPEGIKFISQIPGYQYPTGRIIVDKSICGCGYTEYCLCNEYPIILASPRVVLLENKMEQHPGEANIYYFSNQNLTHSELTFKTWLREFQINHLQFGGRAPKILVTYDSLGILLVYIKEVLGTSNAFNVVVDEFQAIFHDARFKASTELDFINYLNEVNNVLFLSATPMMKKYLDMTPEFCNLPYQKLIWPESAVQEVKIRRKKVRSVKSEVSSVINGFKTGTDIPWKILSDGTRVEAKELVIFCNSISHIASIIKKCELKDFETNIICSISNKEENERKIKSSLPKRLGLGEHKVGKVPKKNEPHFKYTFCTRTSYLGADFYGMDTYTIVCSDCNHRTLAIDISLDLPQIMGRQRREDNNFKNECLFLYTTSFVSDSDKAEYKNMLDDKEEKTTKLLSGYTKLNEEELSANLDVMGREIYTQNYAYNYVGIQNGVPVTNKLAKIADLRAWEVRSEEYQDKVLVKRDVILDGLNNRGYSVTDVSPEDVQDFKDREEKFLEAFHNLTQFNIKMELYCEYLRTYKKYYPDNNIRTIPTDYISYVNCLGVDKIKSLEYKRGNIDKEISNILSGDSRKLGIIQKFPVGTRKSLKNIKDDLKIFYNTLGITKTPKASDLSEYLSVKEILLTIDGKRVKGYEVISVK